MAKMFAITAPTNSVRVDAQRHGEVTYTVFNATGRTLRGRAQIVAEQPEAADWITLGGEAEREFAVAGTEQYPITIALPPDAPAGSYSFRLDMVGVENPDEQYDRGPGVTFEAPAPAPAKKPFPWWVVAVGVGVIVVGVIIALLLTGGGVTIPAIRRGSSEIVARELLREAGVEEDQITTRQEANEDIAAGLVLGTEPPEGEKLADDETVTLVLSAGPPRATVPEIPAGSTQQQAAAALEDAGLQMGGRREVGSETVPEGQVIGTEPPAGEDVAPGTEVTVLISSGPQTVTVRDVEDRTQADATRILQEACEPQPCVNVVIEEETSDTINMGRVTRTDPAVGSEVGIGSDVTVYVSLGPSQVTLKLRPSADAYWDPFGRILYIAPGPDFTGGPQLTLWRAPEAGGRAPDRRLLAAAPGAGALTSAPASPSAAPVITKADIFTYTYIQPALLTGPYGPGLVALRFEYFDVPIDAEIEQALLYLYLESGETPDLQVIAGPALTFWSEEENTRPDCGTTRLAAEVLPTTPGWYSWDVTHFAQDQHADAATNYGFCLGLSEEGRRVFTSREGIGPQEPYLEVTYRR